VSQLVTMFPTVCGNSSVITVFTGPCYETDESSSRLSILGVRSKICFHLRLGRPSCFFPLGCCTTILNIFLFLACYIPCPSHLQRFNHSNDISGKVRVIKLLTVQFSPDRCHLFPLRSPLAPCSQTHSVYVLSLL
jgi:hypothetical protein